MDKRIKGKCHDIFDHFLLLKTFDREPRMNRQKRFCQSVRKVVDYTDTVSSYSMTISARVPVFNVNADTVSAYSTSLLTQNFRKKQITFFTFFIVFYFFQSKIISCVSVQSLTTLTCVCVVVD